MTATLRKENAPRSGQAGEALNEATLRRIVCPDPYSVKGRVLGAFLRQEKLTHKDCWLRFGSSRLSHHAYMLRKEGWPVQMVEEEVTTSDAGRKASIGVYWLDAVVIAKVGEQGQAYARETARIEAERRAA